MGVKGKDTSFLVEGVRTNGFSLIEEILIFTSNEIWVCVLAHSTALKFWFGRLEISLKTPR